MHKLYTGVQWGWEVITKGIGQPTACAVGSLARVNEFGGGYGSNDDYGYPHRRGEKGKIYSDIGQHTEPKYKKI